jgi:hypothetical protein
VRVNQVNFFNAVNIIAAGSEPRLAQSTGPITYQFGEHNGAIVSHESAPFYEVVLRMKFTEKTYSDATHTNLVSSKPVNVEYYVNRYFITQALNTGNIPFVINGEAFYDFLGRNLKHDDNVVYEIGQFKNTPHPGTYCFDMIVYFGGDELYTYYQVNNPTTGIAQERPTYSNIQNGLGLWSSRSVKVLEDLPLVRTNPSSLPSIGNIIALRYSPYTQNITFCDPGSEATDIIGPCVD